MKKVFSIIAVLALTSTFVSCGPSQAELDAAEKAKQDSIRIADSIAAIPVIDTTAVATPVDTTAPAPATEGTEKK